jgi:D-alanyl-D-alanine carboxypeptidase (penicillin-binding protein 5/6)
MNQQGANLGLKRSKFSVAHGMHHDNNYSTALDIAKLSCHAMKNERFREVVNTKSYECVSLTILG